MTATAGDVAMERQWVVDEARSWIGTPFHHAARIKGAGVDCAQLLVGVYEELDLVEPPTIERYTQDWFLHQDRERLLEVVRAHCVPRAPAEAASLGDIALFRYGRSISHGAIVVATGPLRIVHSFRAIGVIEEECDQHSAMATRLAGFWTLRRWAEAT